MSHFRKQPREFRAGGAGASGLGGAVGVGVFRERVCDFRVGEADEALMVDDLFSQGFRGRRFPGRLPAFELVKPYCFGNEQEIFKAAKLNR